MNHEEPMNGHREVAWRDTLTDEEQKHVTRLSEMPTSMAVGYVWVDFNRQMDELRAEHREAMRTGNIIKNVASGVGGGCVVVIGMLGHALGWDQVVNR